MNDKNIRLNEAGCKARKYLEEKEKDLEERERALTLSQNELAMRFKEVSSGVQSTLLLRLVSLSLTSIALSFSLSLAVELLPS